MNYMAEVAKLLGVEIDEDFKCNESPYTYCITKFGCQCNGVYAADSLMMLLDGTITVKHEHWMPKENDVFWHVDSRGNPVLDRWMQYSYHYNFYKIGNCYRTEAEAKADSNKWVAFYASDEVLEV